MGNGGQLVVNDDHRVINGDQLGVYEDPDVVNGDQLGVYEDTEGVNGDQLGVYEDTEGVNGDQLGVNEDPGVVNGGHLMANDGPDVGNGDQLMVNDGQGMGNGGQLAANDGHRVGSGGSRRACPTARRPRRSFIMRGDFSVPNIRSATMPKTLFLLLAFAVIGGFLQNRTKIENWLNPPIPATAGTTAVVLYATEWCGYCAKTRAFFRDHGVTYEERDIEKSAEAKAEYDRLGLRGVPVVVVNGTTVIRGFDPDRMQEALGL